MMILLRIVAVVIGLVAAGYAVAWLRTGQPRYLQIAKRSFIGGLVVALVFFAGLFIERL
jgi:hypothetical protein